MKHFITYGLSIGLLLITIACQSDTKGNDTANAAVAEEPTAELTRYGCNDNQSFSFRQASADEIEANNGKEFIFFTDGVGPQIKMDKVEAGSGAKYSDGNVSVWFKDEEALVEFADEDRTFRNCKEQQ